MVALSAHDPRFGLLLRPQLGGVVLKRRTTFEVADT